MVCAGCQYYRKKVTNREFLDIYSEYIRKVADYQLTIRNWIFAVSAGATELDIEDAALFVEMVAGFYFAIVTAVDAVFFMAAAAVPSTTGKAP